jgi:hypothetical protein
MYYKPRKGEKSMGTSDIKAESLNITLCNFDYTFDKRAVVLHNGEVDQIYNDTDGDVIICQS